MAAPTPPSSPVDVVLLAGSINRIALYPGASPGYKALVEMHGKPLIAYVLDTLQQAEGVGRIFVVGAPPVVEYASQWERVGGVSDGHQLVRNAWRGLRAATTDRVLFCNPDQPLLRPEMVEDFLQRALATKGDLISSWVRHEDLGPYVEGEHKFAKFGDGQFAHGNLFLVRKDMPQLDRVKERLDRIYQARKSNLRFAWALGPSLFGRFLVSLVCGKLPSLQETLEIGGKKFGVDLQPVISPYPEIALDIDEPEDFAAAERYLSDPDFASRARENSSRARERVRQRAAV
jgi:CTP:molybdopterin cytidylyltransferase MocA